jgi:hypothetical protein
MEEGEGMEKEEGEGGEEEGEEEVEGRRKGRKTQQAQQWGGERGWRWREMVEASRRRREACTERRKEAACRVRGRNRGA